MAYQQIEFDENSKISLKSKVEYSIYKGSHPTVLHTTYKVKSSSNNKKKH